ncbi:dTDP-4-dehydrorhamnose 3,5-epimerase family protein [Pseudomonas gingeri]|uniref:dTDP-4-dehydrorhamnose 3,5-epimerase family protein n=1 Tax=Pseudomonas gingeri TaxID=117681 RepID=UPI0015A4A872|nr:dTDP-4-dehydrorhamnose 3,5-epimerase family protein [Pseudomonas gingeri]NWA04456.1 dTDP-4-dehydrorhamnose 3,5-epimerase family protein [Pseudomonas gingeri]NWA15567.1 dTDP-4-dehydrorhamnose 3,5-epimerase family protein [Pseudomonas gingeri]NWA58261.1 dTDP-4-dehydrorhamnose 3,5-epimerase family protein [Pseudomonas gingeri]NWA96063.1 dTDP-4-dehydrorhamnose 3,5-epimerase family protein [Pseudomonas gingeri]NWB04597.1 dTDP-4-dehydrorhamnose 3,5-epimerase family protein [Pseudomonas gingeri]
MNIRTTAISGALVVETQPYQDHRGAFSRLFCERNLAQALGGHHVAQINHSRTNVIGAVRGLHFQYAPHAEMKMVRCLKGRVWDVVVDLRAGSPTFLQWHAEELSPQTGCMLVIPQGCAHGFQVLEAESELLYLHTAFYEPAAEGAVRYDDPRLGVTWPLAVTDLSERDKNHALLSNEFAGLHV